MDVLNRDLNLVDILFPWFEAIFHSVGPGNTRTLLTFLWSRDSRAFWLSTMRWEECAHISVFVVPFVPRKAFAWLYFCAKLLTFLPCVRLFSFVTGRLVRKPSVHVDYAVLLTVIFFFSCNVCIRMVRESLKTMYFFYFFINWDLTLMCLDGTCW